MEYNDKNEPLASSAIQLVLEHLTIRQNELAQQMADLRTLVDRVAKRMDEADHMTSEEYGQQVVQQIMANMPAIQAQAMKAAKRKVHR